jgi:hypothetical protein
LPEAMCGSETGKLTMKKCRNADRYKAIHPPRCGGDEGPCEECARKWAAAIAARKAMRQVQPDH